MRSAAALFVFLCVGLTSVQTPTFDGRQQMLFLQRHQMKHLLEEEAKREGIPLRDFNKDLIPPGKEKFKPITKLRS